MGYLQYQLVLAQLLNQKTVSYPCEKWTPVLVQAGQTGQTDIERHGDAEDNVELETKEQLQNRFISRVFQGKDRERAKGFEWMDK